MKTVIRPARWLSVVALVMISALLTIVTSGGASAREHTMEMLVNAPTEASATVLTVDGTTWTAGTRTPGTSEPVTGGEHFRIGSITKTFVATVVLHMVDEHLVELDAPIEKYLPDVVRDGDRITVRQILQHTSGIPDYMKTPGWSTNRWRGDDRFRDYRPNELLQQAFTRPPDFAPGAKFRYSNSNYIVAGLLIEAVTGNPYGSEIERRILRPLDLNATSLPGSNPRVPDPALRAASDIDGRRVEVTEQNETLDWAAGEMISTQADLATFFDALLGGRLLSEKTLAEMRRTVPMGSGFHYGLGLERFDLPCGGRIWGHGGQLLGYVTYAYRRDDGRNFTLLEVSGTDDGFLRFAAMATAAYCPR
ncbi:serine hydrolase domain-containing protein [Nocardia cyriacigeorgica]|uniref:serine hydrolase domain-containing protein n=2 Tax=Nocardia cyriacigeorgica TaxID=135487 RepID=UPI002458E1B5|nr:serine hydrolase domain-containing protein [Nocardia cyriacigeorgica]